MSQFSSEWIQVSEPFPHVLHVELSRKPVNAFSMAFWRAYGATFERIMREGADVRAVVLSSALPKLFVAGLDLTDTAALHQDAPDAARAAAKFQEIIREFQAAISIPDRCPFPVIAAVHGLVIGLGMDMISACDIRYAASNSSFTIKEVDIGLAADIGTLAFLPKIAGNISLVREMAYTAEYFSPSVAVNMGLVSKVVDGGRDEVIAAALNVAKVIASKSPIAVAGTKRIISHSRDHTVADNLHYTAVWNSAALQTLDTSEGLAATKEKRAPKFLPRSKL
ncbi:Delta2-dienoyl-CoA-isomerase [Mycena floridula]|nr:Delta2-dienoyl-CoA-isomerase [Mycena floridula]